MVFARMLIFVVETLLLGHVQSIFNFLHLVYDEDHSETALKQSAGLIGDLADTFPNGQLKEVLLQDWVAGLVRTKIRNPDVKKTLRWAREVCRSIKVHQLVVLTLFFIDGQTGHSMMSPTLIPHTPHHPTTTTFGNCLYHL